MPPRAQPKVVDLAESLEAAKGRWQALSGDALAEEVASYRAAVVAALAAARAGGAECASDAEFEVAADEGDEEGDVRDGDGELADGGNGAQQGGAEGGALPARGALHVALRAMHTLPARVLAPPAR